MKKSTLLCFLFLLFVAIIPLVRASNQSIIENNEIYTSTTPHNLKSYNLPKQYTKIDSFEFYITFYIRSSIDLNITNLEVGFIINSNINANYVVKALTGDVTDPHRKRIKLGSFSNTQFLNFTSSNQRLSNEFIQKIGLYYRLVIRIYCSWSGSSSIVLKVENTCFLRIYYTDSEPDSEPDSDMSTNSEIKGIALFILILTIAILSFCLIMWLFKSDDKKIIYKAPKVKKNNVKKRMYKKPQRKIEYEHEENNNKIKFSIEGYKNPKELIEVLKERSQKQRVVDYCRFCGNRTC